MKEKNTGNLFKNSIFSFLLNISGTAISFFAIPITLKIMGIQHYGSFVFVQSVAMIVFTLTTIQYWQGLLVELPGKHNDIGVLREQVMRSIAYESFGLAMACVGVLACALPLFHVTQITGFDSTDLLLIVVSALLPSLGSFVAFYRLTNKFHLLLSAGLCANLLRLILLALASHFAPTPSGVIVAYAIPEIMRLLFLGAGVFFSSRTNDAAAAMPVDTGKILSAGKWSTVQSMADLPVANIDKVLVGIALSPEALGIYNILKRLYSIICMATAPVYTNSIPEFSRKINTGDIAGAFSLWRKTIIALLPISIVIGMAAYFSRSLWTAVIYRGLNMYDTELFIVILTSVIAGSFITTHALYWALGRRKQTTAITVASNLLYLLVLWLFSSKFHIAGALGAFLLHVTLVVFVKVVLLLKEKESLR